MKKNIAISGKIASGKSYVSKCIIALGYKPVSIASTLKTLAALSVPSDDSEQISANCRAALELFTKMDPFNTPDIYSNWCFLKQAFKEELASGEKPREFLQALGSMMRSYKDSILIDYVVDRCNEHGYVCDDLRCTNEAELLRNAGWVLVRCNVSEDIRKQRCLDIYGKFGDEQNHFTETELDSWTDWDYLLDTECPIEQQEAKVLKMMNELRLL